MAAPFMSGEDDAGGAIDLTTFGIINLDDVRRSEEFTADAAGIAVDDIAAVASDLERCAHGEEVRDQIIGLALHHDSAEAVLAPVGESTAHPGTGTITPLDAVGEILRSDDHIDLSARNICLWLRPERRVRKDTPAR